VVVPVRPSMVFKVPSFVQVFLCIFYKQGGTFHQSSQKQKEIYNMQWMLERFGMKDVATSVLKPRGSPQKEQKLAPANVWFVLPSQSQDSVVHTVTLHLNI